MSRNEKFNLIIQLSVPSILAQVTTVLMFYIDAGMVGSLGAEPSAAIGLVEPATWLIFSLVSAVTMGFSVQVAHFIGANDFPKARAVMRHGYVFGLCFSLLMLLIAFLIGPRLPIWLGGGTDIQHDAMVYFLIFSCITPFHLIEYMSGAMLKVAGDMRRPSMMAILMCVLDVIFNYFLIFPTRTISLFGIELTMPGFGAGVAGAALGSLLAFVCVALPLAYYAIFRSPILAWKQDIERFSWRWQYIWNALKISAPMGLQYLLMNGAQLVSTMIVAPLGNVAIAAHSFAITAESLCYMPGYGISEAATTLVGQSVGADRDLNSPWHVVLKSVGADRRDLHRSFAWMTVFLGMIVMAFMGVVMYIFAPEMIGLLSPVTAIQDLGTSVLRIEAFAEPFFAAAIVAYSVCVGAGDTLKPSMINLGSMWLIRLTLAYCLASQYGLRGVWFAMAVELSLRGMMFIFYLFKRLRKT